MLCRWVEDCPIQPPQEVALVRGGDDWSGPQTNAEDRIQPKWDTKNIPIGQQPHQVTKVGGALKPEEEELLSAIITQNKDLFAWSSADMSGIHPDVMSHKLAIFMEAWPIA